MKKMILIGTLALLAACGNASDGGSKGTTADQSSSDDTISVSEFGDMPQKCIDLFSTFLKGIEPTISKVDWKTETLAQFEALNASIQPQSDAFNAQTAAAGCQKYSLEGSDAEQHRQVIELAAKEAPGTVPFLTFFSSLTDAPTSAGTVPADCQADIAAIEPYLGKGTTMKDLTMTEVTELGKLMNAVSTNCTPEESQAFASRADVTAFISG